MVSSAPSTKESSIGPRIYPSGAFISQTSGHGDFRFSFEVPRLPGGPLSHSEVEGIAAIADSPDEVRLRTREQLRQGASQIKLMAGGGVASPYNPIESTQYTEPEIRAAVEAADNWGTYVTVHAYTPRAIRQAVAAGVKCIEHGQLIDEPTAKLLADNGIWWSLQPLLDDEDAPPLVNPVSQKKALEVFAGTDNAYKLAKKYNVKTAFGTDILFDARLTTRQGAILAKMVRWYTPAEALKMATADNGELMALSGFINPYPGKLGVVEEGAIADLAAGRRQSAGKYQARRRPGQELSRHHEGRHDLQRHRDEVGEDRHDVVHWNGRADLRLVRGSGAGAVNVPGAVAGLALTVSWTEAASLKARTFSSRRLLQIFLALSPCRRQK